MKALKEGSTEITATAQGHTEKIKIVVLSSSPAVDATKDIGINGGNGGGNSSSGGCSGGFGIIMLISVLALKAITLRR
ncbi:MAG: hypothetical protein IJR85_10340 [Synergistaceae bacterium]|nr:hypothetical protein [Synergistaceae bacterium]